MNAAKPGLAFSAESGLLVGFGRNLLHCDNSNTCRLFAKGQEILRSSVTVEVPDFIPALKVGTKGEASQITKDRFGNVITSSIVVEAIHDVPEDFLVTGVTTSPRFTGAFFKIQITIRGATGDGARIKTTYNVLTRTLPLGVEFTPLGQAPAIDPNAADLLGIAARIVQQGLDAAGLALPTELDFSWKKVFGVAAVVSAALAKYVLTSPVIPPQYRIPLAVALVILGAVFTYLATKDIIIKSPPIPIP